MSAGTSLDVLDAWESLRDAVLARAPAAGELLRDRKQLTFQDSPRDRGAVAIAVALDRPVESPAERRHARSLLADLERDGHVRTMGAAVHEEIGPAYKDIEESRRIVLGRDAEWAMGETVYTDLQAAAGPVAAMKYVERASTLLKGRRAAAFLLHIGYPIVIPDKSKRRWLQRFGLLDDVKESTANRYDALRIFGELSMQTGTSLPEIDLLLGVFVGEDMKDERGATLCVAKPRCGECPIRRHCQYGRFLEKHGKLDEDRGDKRTLQEVFLPEDRPREKLMNGGAQTLTNAELLAIILRTGTGKEHAVELSNRILREAGSLDRLAQQSIAEMTRIPGLGPVKAVTIKAALELARRLTEVRPDEEKPFTSARDIFNRLRGFMLDKKKECFVALLLDTKYKLMRRVIISEGTLNQSLVHPREAFQDALRDSAYAVIFAHNHPSGDPTPSRDDRVVTQRLVQVGDIVGVRVLDHIIVGRDTYYSFADSGELNK